MGTTVFILTTSPYAKSSIPLGSLVPDRSTPSTDLLTAEGITKDHFSKDLDKNFDALIHGGSDTWFEALLSNFLAFTLRAERSSQFYVTAERGYIYLLKQPKAVFSKLVAKEETKKWLEDGYRDGQDTWFIIGKRTFVNAKLHRERRKAGEASAKVKAPISEQVAGDPSGTADIGAGAGHKGWEEVSGAAETVGERVYAICYRKVNVRCKKGKIDAKLQSGNVWKSFASTRGHATVDDEEFLEAEIAETEDDMLDGYSLTGGTGPGGEEVIFAIPPCVNK